mmetsp:Transcript_50180/g.113905  ORF Transcript_50180/g.113905 Transcript_50180/m.113905 type:complete len:304 (+) Transcript_50180:62-973(+)
MSGSALALSLMASLTPVVALASLARPQRILCYGDSLTAGTTSLGYFPYASVLEAGLKSRGLDVVVNHLGYPGWTADTLVQEADGPDGLKFLLRASKPEHDLAIILAGTNDLGYPGQGEKPREFQIFDNIWALHLMAHERGVKTLAISIPESGYQSAVASARALRDSVNQLLQKKCQEPKSMCAYFDCPVPYDRTSGLWEEDGLHFSPQGYSSLGKSLVPVVHELLAGDVGPGTQQGTSRGPKPSHQAAQQNLGSKKNFPAHWGEPPNIQTRDYRPWPGGYGAGSGTIAKWIKEKMDEDEKSGL